MKKVFFLIFSFLSLVTIVYLSSVGLNYVQDTPLNTPLSSALSVNASTKRVAMIFEQKCMDCHSNKGQMPFYGKLPFINKIINEHIEEGLEEFNLIHELFKSADNISERTLQHIEEVVEEDEMPPLTYRALHWKNTLTPEEQAFILSWVSLQKSGQS